MNWKEALKHEVQLALNKNGQDGDIRQYRAHYGIAPWLPSRPEASHDIFWHHHSWKRMRIVERIERRLGAN
jgi:hypothetical protein